MQFSQQQQQQWRQWRKLLRHGVPAAYGAAGPVSHQQPAEQYLQQCVRLGQQALPGS